MIDKETWKIGADRDTMEKLIKYNMHPHYCNVSNYDILK